MAVKAVELEVVLAAPWAAVEAMVEAPAPVAAVEE